jgi:alkanesulfonate monooxygenase SsuD/methylene tetrahydromethanopterin reductase-like flavin-dependent oxidoreductase (luciferase family)
MRFGVFFAPFHPVGQSPTLALEYDLDRAVALDRLGYDEVWFGEHQGTTSSSARPRSSSPWPPNAPATSASAPA